MTGRRRVTPTEVEKAVRNIQERDGVCSPEAFVEEASDPKSPLHNLFEWDDATEAHQWRVHRARQIIGRFRITAGGVPTPANVHVTIVEGGRKLEGYVPIERALSDEEMAQQVFREAASGLAGWRRRLTAFRHFHAADSAVGLLDQAIAELNPDTDITQDDDTDPNIEGTEGK
ncbi:hypothetical protein A5731_22760 [Mycolicibacterium conceptionense]|uniref:Uncharacterized protein n=1 Tax=Mycolicibacterium conceptionense TaxID=451644 RepID=A0A1A1VVF7_9MYCO|nr:MULTISPECIES: hypothetical protein [Mycolicibacterium]MCW1820798.1 hypothetical protein [Mycolicibacterium senegalense]OBB10703.1 hypothetical protein A5718_07780 [Mycolicibacterium conceptionense]OBE98519.1 hypothetical protein A5731_22760 [Mycolicibacterium conceptionense]OBF15050.1 hypothetical protein A5726_23000 [Mycolicibacterium conceptionense]OBF30617.1 hypothetical protein A5720_29685 [Mycolicibacterium conceptionense]